MSKFRRVENTPTQETILSRTFPTPLSLRKNLSWTFAGNIAYAFCQWGMLVVLAKLGSPEQVGQFALGLAVTAPVVLFANLGLRPVQATDARLRYAFSDYLGLRLATTALAFLAIVVVVVIAGYHWDTALVILVIGLAKSFEAVSDVFYGMLQRRERMDRIAKSMMIKGPLSLIALSAMVYLTGDVLWGVVGLAVSWALVLVVYDVRSGALILKSSPQVPGSSVEEEGTREEPWPRWRARTLWRLAILALPLGFVTVLISLNANVPRYLVEHYLGQRELGIFSALAYVMLAGVMVTSALGQSASSRLARYYADLDYPAFRALLLKLTCLGALLGAVGVLVSAVAGREILTLLYTPEYAEHLNVFLWLMVAAALNYAAAFLGYGIMAARYFRAQVPLYAGVLGTTAVACVVLVPRIGLLGAGMAMALGMAFQLVASAGVLAYTLRNTEKGGGDD